MMAQGNRFQTQPSQHSRSALQASNFSTQYSVAASLAVTPGGPSPTSRHVATGSPAGGDHPHRVLARGQGLLGIEEGAFQTLQTPTAINSSGPNSPTNPYTVLVKTDSSGETYFATSTHHYHEL